MSQSVIILVEDRYIVVFIYYSTHLVNAHVTMRKYLLPLVDFVRGPTQSIWRSHHVNEMPRLCKGAQCTISYVSLVFCCKSGNSYVSKWRGGKRN